MTEKSDKKFPSFSNLNSVSKSAEVDFSHADKMKNTNVQDNSNPTQIPHNVKQIVDLAADHIKKESEQQFSRFADYFVICGLDLDTGLEPDRFAGDSLHCSPLDRTYKSKPLAHYPENVSWNPFDSHGICMLSLPQGLRFRTQKHNIEPKFHSFATTREDGKRCHGFSLIFFEEVRNRNICSAMHTLQAMFITELSNGQNAASLRRIKEKQVSKSLPRHFKVAGQAPQSALSYYDITKDKLYVAKSISLICQIAYAYTAEIFLKNLYKCLPRQPGPGISLESYVYNILYEVILPQPGKSIRIYLPPEEPQLPPIPLVLQRPVPGEELPLLDFSLRLLFTYLGVDCVIQLFTCVLLENQVLLRSSDYQKLMVVGECVTSLLFPFKWPHVYAPILPAALHHFLDAPVPFVMGLHADCEANVKVGSEATLCYVDIDKKLIQLPEELPVFPHKADFIAEIISVLDKFNIERDKSLEPNIRNCHIGLNNSRKSDYDSMTSSCTLPSGMQTRRKQILYESHATSDFNGSSHHVEYQPLIAHPKLDHVPRVADFLRRKGNYKSDMGVDTIDSMPLNYRKQQESDSSLNSQEQYYQDQRINNSLREIFLNRFVHMFSAYEYFVIYPNQDKNDWLTNRESLQNFDKSSFLSDQPEHHVAFLSRFLESQMFVTLIDNKIISMWEGDIDQNLKLFDTRIRNLRKRYGGEGVVRATSYEPCVLSQEMQNSFEKKQNSIDMEAAPPSEILPNRPAYFRSFPILEKSVLNQECTSRSNSLRRVKNGTKWRAKDIPLDDDKSLTPNRNSANISTSEISPALIAQANWTFVERLLKDIKAKTKRMLLEKMGTEAVELGLRGDASTSGVEENTLIASLCDLLEKVWSHGLQNKQGKSALWSHLQIYFEKQELHNHSSHVLNTSYSTNALAWNVIRKRVDCRLNDLSTIRIEPESPQSPNKGPSRALKNASVSEHLCSIPESLEFDIKNVLAMTDIKTHIGYTRAWVRLSLEKKLLSRHLRTLLSEQSLLRSLYKRSSFLRCEEEKEQFLYHLLTLNTVDYWSFTNTYPNTKLPYRVVIFPSRKYGNYQTSSNVWVQISGSLTETQCITIPKGSLEFIFHHKNVGILTTMRIGHDNSGPSSKWMVEFVIIRNEVTGHTYRFPCGRWLGKGVDDDSTERLLVGQLVLQKVENADISHECPTPPRARSPSIQRVDLTSSEIQNKLASCVNIVVKWHYKPSRERDIGSLTNLLCGNNGLVKCLEQVFLFGFRSSRFFGRNFYIWDFLTKTKEHSESSLSQEAQNTSNNLNAAQCNEFAAVWRYYIHLIDEINVAGDALGKDGKFQLFICLSLRDHLLARILIPLSLTKATHEMYEEESFFRRKGLLTFLVHILEPLDDFNIVLENSITQGISTQF